MTDRELVALIGAVFYSGNALRTLSRAECIREAKEFLQCVDFVLRGEEPPPAAEDEEDA